MIKFLKNNLFELYLRKSENGYFLKVSEQRSVPKTQRVLFQKNLILICLILKTIF